VRINLILGYKSVKMKNGISFKSMKLLDQVRITIRKEHADIRGLPRLCATLCLQNSMAYSYLSSSAEQCLNVRLNGQSQSFCVVPAL
jgi:hypothetical protein